ncbi:ArpU family phage packaging/lysis transcriptional regulator [Psychrobacillus sp. L3]|uniref:ArpU family phage packaging/lysis transcriptional regulator n=1 Tax=Psychrobacillus sp. L3 TaxID=3236891 RepID=UPI0036F36D70
MPLHFDLPEINREATKKVVQSTLEKYRLYLLQLSLDKLPSVTAKYTLMPPSHNLPSSSTENVALANVDYERECSKFIELILRAVNRLSDQERKLIILRYFAEDEEFDYQVYAKLNISERQYYRLKVRAFYKLAFALKIEVYKEKGVNAS